MNEYTKYYMDQAAGIFSAPQIQKGYGQRGRGIGRLLRNFMRWVTPLAQKHILPKIESGAKFLGNNIVDALSNTAKDAIQGHNLNEAAKGRFYDLVENVKEKTENTLEGKGIKNKKSINKSAKKKSYVILKKTNNRTKDIFDYLQK